MKKVWYGIAIGAIALGAIGFVANSSAAQEHFGRGQAESTDAPTATEELPAVLATDDIVVDANVVPLRESNLSPATNGIVTEILVSEGDYVDAGTTLLMLENSRQQASVAQAEANLRSAELQLAELVAEPRSEEVARYQASVTSAQASLQNVLDGAGDADITVARADLAKAEATLRQAQANYDTVSWRTDIGMMPQATELERATNDYVAAKARLEDLLAGPNRNDVAGAQASVNSAQADLDNFLAGATTEVIASAEAGIDSAKATLMDARAAYEQTILRAPFAGTIASIEAELGELVSAGMTTVTLADLSNWVIETEDLTELSVVNVQPGDHVDITLDALPDTTLTGTVVTLKPVGESKQGDITYTATITLDQQDERLRWNMSAETIITVDEAGRAASQKETNIPTAAKVQAAEVPPLEAAPLQAASSTDTENPETMENTESTSGINAVVWTQGANLNVRSGPGMDYAIIDSLSTGSEVSVTYRNGDSTWALVGMDNGEQGWVSSSYIELESPIEGLPMSDFVSEEVDWPPAADVADAAFSQIDNDGGAASSGTFVFQTGAAGDIYSYDLTNGATRQLTNGMDPALSPDGQTVAFVRDGGAHGLYLIDIDGSNERLIYSGNEFLRTPSWSPAGDYIVFSRSTGEYECRALGGGLCLPDNPFLSDLTLVGKVETGLSRVDINGEDFRDIPSLNTATAPAWSDGGIVYQSATGIQLTGDSAQPNDRSVAARYSYEDPDMIGDRVVFQSEEGNHREIFTANSDGSNMQALTRPLDLLADEYPQNVSPVWSPDGAQILYVSNRGDDGSADEWGLWLMNADGSNAQRLPIALDFAYAFQGEQMVSW